MFLSNFKITEKRLNEVTSPMSGYQGQLKVQDLLRRCDTDLSCLYLRPRQFIHVGISCLNNGLLRH